MGRLNYYITQIIIMLNAFIPICRVNRPSTPAVNYAMRTITHEGAVWGICISFRFMNALFLIERQFQIICQTTLNQNIAFLNILVHSW